MEELMEIEGAVQKEKAPKKKEDKKELLLTDLVPFDDLFRVNGKKGVFVYLKSHNRFLLMADVLGDKRPVNVSISNAISLKYITYTTREKSQVTLKDLVNMMFTETKGGFIEIENMEGMKDAFGLPDFIAKRIVDIYNALIELVVKAQNMEDGKE